MTYTTLTTRRDHGVEYLTLNRPEVRNALNDTMVNELTAWAEGARADHTIRVVVLGGEGPVFSAGADVSSMAKSIDDSKEDNLRHAVAMSHMFTALNTLPVPVVARVQGAAIGGGAGFCAVCDVVVADDQARFGFTEVRLGLVPALISPFVIEKIGRSAARELFLTGARVSAGRAREIGLVHTVVPLAQLDNAVAGHVRDLMAGGREALATAKRLIADVVRLSPHEAECYTSDVISTRRVSAEAQEGLRAFLEKRPPSWTDT